MGCQLLGIKSINFLNKKKEDGKICFEKWQRG